ncbi:hypothetical protein PV08_11505 [Exophiala spinifera]|uniref:JmjC domain-containing protein n=1 Tax=Exophiala spinifera TaxID=91928 RepID=A0A0D1Y6Q5_9EURO|nr:uncharacterized protein PV08_11505 [Exophiala spinifera]KIW10541.1 hypothetical protein PV08_11505 [Exophiala spinifera]
MQCLAPQRPSFKALADILYRHRRHQFSTSQPRLQLKQVPFLSSWNQDVFEREAYLPATPARLPRSAEHIPPACSKWFIHDNDVDFVLTSSTTSPSTNNSTDVKTIHFPTSSELRTSFWSDYESAIVPLEITSKGNRHEGEEETFERIEAPLKVLLTYLSNPDSSISGSSTQLPPPSQENKHSIYLAQCDLTSLPSSVVDDIPTPTPLRIVSSSSSSSSSSKSRCNPDSISSGSSSTSSAFYSGEAGGNRPKKRRGMIKGDIYASSLWLGRPPTYTPLHRDPNPNLFIQLAGRKAVRLLPPEVGGAIFDDVQDRIRIASRTARHTPSSATIRGDEMMVGPEKVALHDAIWLDDDDDDYDNHVDSDTDDDKPKTKNRYSDVLRTYGLETHLQLGDALFIPKGWWHSVKGVGHGVTASVNWWFR